MVMLTEIPLSGCDFHATTAHTRQRSDKRGELVFFLINSIVTSGIPVQCRESQSQERHATSRRRLATAQR